MEKKGGVGNRGNRRRKGESQIGKGEGEEMGSPEQVGPLPQYCMSY